MTAPRRRSIYERTTRGLRIYLATPRLRALLAINMAVAAAGAIVFVNTVVYVQDQLGLGERQTAIALAAFGCGSMMVALTLPSLLRQRPDRPVMLAGAALLAVAAALVSTITAYGALLALWFLIGLGYAAAQVPSGRLLRRSAHAEDRPALFAAQFALSHACWLFTYPLAGIVGARIGLSATATGLALIACVAAVLAWRLWPSPDRMEIAHRHPELSRHHPHLADARQKIHRHPFVIDDLHHSWPERH